MEEIAGMGNRDGFIPFRMNNAFRAFVAHHMANRLRLQDVLNEARAELLGVELESAVLSRNPLAPCLDQFAQPTRVGDGAPQHQSLCLDTGSKCCCHGSAQGKSL